MKRLISLLLTAVVLVTFCACAGNFAKIDLQEAVTIPDNGLIEKDIIEQIKTQNAIATFVGESNGIPYEWTIFGSDITQPKDLNLLISVEEAEQEANITFAQQEAFGFPVLLSVHLNALWDAQSATAYLGEQPVASVSLTGTDATILNLGLEETVEKFVVRPDIEPEKAVIPDVTKPEPEESSQQQPEKQPEQTEQQVAAPVDDYLSDVKESNDRVYSDGKTEDDRVYSDGKDTEKDQYLTDPVPEGKPMPVEPENQVIDKRKTYTCTFSIECSTILNNLEDLDPDKLEMVPSNGTILAKTEVEFYEGESVYDVLQRVCRENGIHMEASWTPIYNSSYVEGIHNLYEFDCGSLSGWMYRVDGWYPNYGCSRYQLKDGERVEWRYTCDLGNDVGGGNLF